MDVDKRSLELQKAQQELERSLLDMEHKYGLIGGPTTIDPRSATIEEPPAARSSNGKGKAEDLREVEVLLMGHPAVAEAQVVGVPDDRLSEVACACIVAIDGQEITEGSLIDYCRGKLASFKLPRHVLFMEGYPMTPSGKVQKFKLRELAEKKLEL